MALTSSGLVAALNGLATAGKYVSFNTQGESWFTHLHFGLTADGIFG